MQTNAENNFLILQKCCTVDLLVVLMQLHLYLQGCPCFILPLLPVQRPLCGGGQNHLLLGPFSFLLQG